MCSVNFKQLRKMIQDNNGTLSTSVLANLLGKQHGHLCDKLKAQLGESLLSKFENTENYEKGLGKVGTRTVYMLPEKEAIALAMSYNMTIGMEVYQAFREYETALVNVTEATTLMEAQSIAKSALDIAIDKAIENGKQGIGVGKQRNKALRLCTSADQMIDTLKRISQSIQWIKTDTGREGFWRQSRTQIQEMQESYRKDSKKFDITVYSEFEKVAHYTTKRIAQCRTK